MSRSLALFGCFSLFVVCLTAGCETKGPTTAGRSGAESTSSSSSTSSGSSTNTSTPAATSTSATESAQSADRKPAETLTKSDPAEAADSKQPGKVAAADSSTSTKLDHASPTPLKTFEPDPLDWPNWRGPEQNRISRETGLIDHWDPETKENVLWVNDDAGSISSPIVMRGKVYSIGRYKPGEEHEQEQVVCVDAESGKTLWQAKHNMFLAGVPAERVGWASVVGDPTTGRVYSYGTNCLMQCLDGDTGKVIWERSLMEEFGFLSVYGGRTNFPVVFDDLVIISSVETGWGDKAPPAHRFIAFDKNTGELRWFNAGTTPLPEDTTYSTPTITMIDGQMQLIEGSSDGAVWAFQPRTGQPIWHYRMSWRGLNVSPLVVGNTVYMGQGEENLNNSTQGMLLAFKAGGQGDITGKADIWKLRGVMESKSSPILVDGRIYAADDGGRLYIVDAATGKLITKVKLLGTIVRGSPLYADGKIYLCSTSGWHCFRVTPKGLELVQKLRLDPVDEVSGSPVVSHGRIFLPTGARLYCLGAKEQKPAATPISIPSASEKPAAADDKPALVQVVPAEALLASGQKQPFRVRLFNVRGQFLKESEAEFTLAGPGQIAKSGLYQAANDRSHSATIVTAKVGYLTGQARVRVVPPLPWTFNFQKIPLTPNPKTMVLEGLPPVTWIGLRYRHVIRQPSGEEFGGRKVMVKVNTIPKGTHSQGWMGPHDLHDYTIQADVMADTNNQTSPEAGMADLGLIAQRYDLMLMGADQKLRIVYWTPQSNDDMRFFKKVIPFAWKPHVWYSTKFRAETAGDKAVLRGKVWPRSEKEPDSWTIEATDDVPNLVGSPGLIGDTTGKGEFYLDNIRVDPNAETVKTADTGR